MWKELLDIVSAHLWLVVAVVAVVLILALLVGGIVALVVFGVVRAKSDLPARRTVKLLGACADLAGRRAAASGAARDALHAADIRAAEAVAVARTLREGIDDAAKAAPP